MTGIKINSEKLRKILIQRGLTAGNVSYEMGHGRNYFSDSFRRGSLSRHAVVYLENKYNIKLEDYEAVQEEKREERSKREERVLKDMTDKQMYQLIYSAVYHAVKKAWTE